MMLLDTLNNAEDQIDRELARLQGIELDLYAAKDAFNKKQQQLDSDCEAFDQEKEDFKLVRQILEAEQLADARRTRELRKQLAHVEGTVEWRLQQLQDRQRRLDKFEGDVHKRDLVLRMREAAFEDKEKSLKLAIKAGKQERKAFEAEKSKMVS